MGTCITALIAALGVVGVNSGFALQIALVHLIYNVLGVTLIYGVRFLRDIPINLSYQLSVLASEQKLYGAAYVGGLFFIIPLGIIFTSMWI